MGEGSFLLLFPLTVGCIHALLGPDHYVPLIALGQTHHWSKQRLFRMTVSCAVIHTLSSAVIGFIGIAGYRVLFDQAQAVDRLRGDLVAWSFMAIGLVYVVLGLKKKFHRRKACFPDSVLFALFALGPCEPLVPLVMHPSAMETPVHLMLVVGTFTVATTFTMLAVVWAGCFGLRIFKGQVFKDYAYSLTGTAMVLCGAGVKFLGF